MINHSGTLKKKIKDYQNKRLRQIISIAYSTVPYYNRTMNNLGLIPSDIQTIEDLTKLPVINKEIIASNFDDFISKHFQKKSIGLSEPAEQLEFLLNILNLQVQFHLAGHQYTEDGNGQVVILVKKKVKMGGSSLVPNAKVPFYQRVRDAFEQNYNYPSASLNDDIIKSYIKEIKKNELKRYMATLQPYLQLLNIF